MVSMSASVSHYIACIGRVCSWDHAVDAGCALSECLCQCCSGQNYCEQQYPYICKSIWGLIRDSGLYFILLLEK